MKIKHWFYRLVIFFKSRINYLCFRPKKTITKPQLYLYNVYDTHKTFKDKGSNDTNISSITLGELAKCK